MSYGMRVSIPGVDVLSGTANTNGFALRSDDSTVLIKEKTRGSVSLNYAAASNIAHGLSYTPFGFVWGNDINGNLIYGCTLNNIGGDNQWITYVNGTALTIAQVVHNDGTARTALYYIFYDQVT